MVRQVTATLRFGDVLQAADMVCSTAFDRDDEFFATAGVSRRIKARHPRIRMVCFKFFAPGTEVIFRYATFQSVASQ